MTGGSTVHSINTEIRATVASLTWDTQLIVCDITTVCRTGPSDLSMSRRFEKSFWLTEEEKWQKFENVQCASRDGPNSETILCRTCEMYFSYLSQKQSQPFQKLFKLNFEVEILPVLYCASLNEPLGQTSARSHRPILEPPESTIECSDITNALVGISGETVPEGGNLCIYCVQWCHLWAVVLNSQLVCHTTLLPHQGVLASTANFNYSEYFYKN